jgi:hypothetical protein
VGAELFHVGGQTDRHGEAMHLKLSHMQWTHALFFIGLLKIGGTKFFRREIWSWYNSHSYGPGIILVVFNTMP